MTVTVTGLSEPRAGESRGPNDETGTWPSMAQDDAESLRRVVGNLVEVALSHGADFSAMAKAFVLTDAGMTPWARSELAISLHAVERRASGRERVLVSRDWIADRFGITSQGVSYLCTAGRLEMRKIRVGKRRRSAIPLWSACEHFDVSPEERDEITADLPRDDEGLVEPTFLCPRTPQAPRMIGAAESRTQESEDLVAPVCATCAAAASTRTSVTISADP